MNKLMKSLLLFVLIFSFNTVQTFAFEINNGDNVEISAEVMDDLYILAGNASIDAPVLGDVYVLGGSVMVNADIKEDLVIVGGMVTVLGNVDGDLRLLGGKATVYGNVKEDVVALGMAFDLGPDAVVEGSILTGSGILTIDGNVMKDISGATGMFILNGNIGGNVSLTIDDSILLSEESSIGGDLNYSSFLESDFPQNVVKGSINFSKFTEDINMQIEDETETIANIFSTLKIIGFISSLVLILILVIFAPRLIEKSGKLCKEHLWKSFSLGLLTMILASIGSIVLMITVVGVPVAMIVLALLVIVFYMAKIFVAAWLASYIIDFKKRKNIRTRLFGAMTLMLLAYYLLSYVPYVGGLINIVLFLIGVGSIVLLKVEYVGYLKSKKML